MSIFTTYDTCRSVITNEMKYKGNEAPPEDKPLIRHYYKKHNTCANVEPFVKHQVSLFWSKDKSLTAKFLKLLYADCMVNGCDASILLDGTNSEKTAAQNAGLGLWVFEVIDKIKTVLEKRCPRAVSCADILNLATRDAVHFAGAPSYPVYLGRKDGLESNAAWVDLPSPSISWESALKFFESKGLDILDMTTLLGAHSMGRTHCRYIWDRLYNFNNTGKRDPSMKKSFLKEMRKQCPLKLKSGQSDPLLYLNPVSGPNYNFTNTYYSRVLSGESVLGVDQQLRFGNDTKQISKEFAEDIEDFRGSFALSISRMGGLRVLTGDKGQIRLNCRYVNQK
ncbi:probable peroxidase 26 [Actinidia eriantha]|uniref:probable peroxidase 26 n=1 Tax=Actinidia eriantha TaxID=165200 RepID=UPI00258C421F|nr:probable peroxidase 26 [Actinidia eriantha]